MSQLPTFTLLDSPDWRDYELLDSGDGRKLERFGPYRFVRPEAQALWMPRLPQKQWDNVHAVFQGAGDDDGGGRWQIKQPFDQRWPMRYKQLQFWAEATPFRHLGVFPEQANHWDWMSDLITNVRRPVKVLNLFGYTGVASLAAAGAGGHVTHVDASKKVITWAHENQTLSGLDDKPLRWIVDDALKFVQREGRRGNTYDGMIIDPPKFGRGPKGEVWKFDEALPTLLDACRQILSPQPLFVVLTAYAIRASALSVHYALQDMMGNHQGTGETGEMVLVERSGNRVLSTALFARWRGVTR
jgi:23S rRNA (cytosine1962-C5)-methyltransferase